MIIIIIIFETLFLQGSVGTLNRRVGQYIDWFVVNLYMCIPFKNYEKQLTFDKAFQCIIKLT